MRNPALIATAVPTMPSAGNESPSTAIVPLSSMVTSRPSHAVQVACDGLPQEEGYEQKSY